ncbi:hypothetical protein PTSG_03445 [Salpingoeca rosetta]|uniref:Uncharacterized protein n=1 Tax=Salpingoeca rosetta (strain ATCC 50818 / BSB-021) TaxID=946362 RepID=F2U578_SALR5|nr:uncharacterized protein PTSG_03445 [Salpingoeca rosetta]XP_012493084.1 hypothetical protein, variant [Salpingoeca rosetta]EGD82794.1 hypothetical protein, variant [Salpingoeca rosetta]EGD82795.1 hypothetical protein PTSG_03445 [Salpingoeca rosetta]|eukprot:XP_004996030.1 hypothetical protein PTSG_03445 [Salpingoeca rosetta]
MTDRESSWALAPERGLDQLEREEPNEWDGIYNEVPTFEPDLMSSPELRTRARSSGYGKSVPVVKRVVLEPNDLRPWEEVPTFKPELQESPIRKSAPSSNYGRAIPTRKEVAPEIPKFKPEIQRSPSAQRQFSTVKSSGYGRVSAAVSRPSSAPSLKFRPQMPKSKLRQSVKSSGYGRVLPDAKRPSSAPRRSNSMDTSTTPSKFVPRYSLLMDRSDKEAAEDAKNKETEEGEFVLDGLSSVNSRSKLELSFGLPPNHTPSPKQKALRDSASSSKYGLASPPVAPRQYKERGPVDFSFDKSSSVLDQPLEPFATKTPLADKVRSSQYGKAPPPRGEKPAPKQPEPRWSLTFKGEVPRDPPAAPRNQLTEKVASHGYGQVSPEKGPRFEMEVPPLWIPSNNPRVKLSEPTPVPRSRLNDSVRSHYGTDYDPTSLYAFNGEDEFDDEAEEGIDGPFVQEGEEHAQENGDEVVVDEGDEEEQEEEEEEQEEFEEY